MELRFAIVNDLDIIMDIEQRRFHGDDWNYDHWKYELTENAFSKTIVLAIDSVVVGYINYWIIFEQATINKVCVDEGYLRKGYGDILVKEALKEIDKAYCVSTSLEVRVSNMSAIYLYQKNLFKTVLRKESYYSDGEDCYFMLRSIGDVYEG